MSATAKIAVFGGIFFVGAIVLASCIHTESVEPGQHGVIIDKPYIFGSSGVRPDVLKDGRVFIFRSSSMTHVNMLPQSQVVKFDDLASADGILLDFESSIQFQFTDAAQMVSRFGTGWFTANIEQPFRAIVRDAVKKKTMQSIMTDVQAAADIDVETTTRLQALLNELKMPIRIAGVSLGRAKPNETVLAQMNETAAQQQRKKTLVEAEAAEVQRKREQVAKADADNAYRNAMQLSPDMFLALEKIKRFADACKESKGTCIVDAGDGSTNIMAGARK